MDPITTAIVAALAAGAMGSLTDASKAAITDGYSKLKVAIQKRFGANSDVVQAIDKLEKKPESQGRKETLAEEIVAIKAEQDAELLSLAEHIRELLKEYAKDNTAVKQIITGDYNATSVHGDASVTVHAPKDV